MKPDELKHSVIFQVLKKNKKAQQAALKLSKNEDWVILRQFVGEVKQTLMEAAFESDQPSENLKHRFLIRGMESVVLLPRLVDLVKDMEKKAMVDKKESEAEAKRKKYNPGAFLRGQISKLKK